MKRLRLSCIVSFLVFFAVGCSPVYQTRYTYYPITGTEGQMCSNTCLVAKQACLQSEFQRYQNCESQANLQYQLCQLSKVYSNDSKGNRVCVSNCYCYRPTCGTPNDSACEETYKDCYLNCGGEVIATTSCVRNCKDAIPPQTQHLRQTEYGSIVDVTGM